MKHFEGHRQPNVDYKSGNKMKQHLCTNVYQRHINVNLGRCMVIINPLLIWTALSSCSQNGAVINTYIIQY